MTANLSECDKCFSSNCKLNLCKRVYLIGASMVKLAKCQIENRFIGSSTVDAILSGGKRFGFSKCPDFEGKNRAEVKSSEDPLSAAGAMLMDESGDLGSDLPN